MKLAGDLSIPPFSFLWGQSINNLHNLSTSIFNVPAKGLLSYRSQSVGFWCALLWNSQQTQTVPEALLSVCVHLCACMYEKMFALLFFSFIVLFMLAFVWMSVGVSILQREEARSSGAPLKSCSISGEGRIMGVRFLTRKTNEGTQAHN